MSSDTNTAQRSGGASQLQMTCSLEFLDKEMIEDVQD